jgi:hypothetical protein
VNGMTYQSCHHQPIIEAEPLDKVDAYITPKRHRDGGDYDGCAVDAKELGPAIFARMSVIRR